MLTKLINIVNNNNKNNVDKDNNNIVNNNNKNNVDKD